MRALKDRLVKLIEGNWREKAEVLLNERKMAAAKGQGKLKVSLCLSEAYIDSYARCLFKLFEL